jgi:hypothetical protein
LERYHQEEKKQASKPFRMHEPALQRETPIESMIIFPPRHTNQRENRDQEGTEKAHHEANQPRPCRGAIAHRSFIEHSGWGKPSKKEGQKVENGISCKGQESGEWLA